MRACTVDGCLRPHNARGLCYTHYKREERQSTTRPRCTIKGCERPTASLGMCHAHYKRSLDGRPLDAPLKERRPRQTVLERDELGRKRCTNCDLWKPEGGFSARTLSPDGLHHRCRDCASNYKRALVYRMTPDRWSEMLMAQGGRCAVCGAAEPGGPGAWHVDHDHACCPSRASCGECVRGLLCTRCNATLGYVKDDPATLRALADYLERTARQ
jgi:hypothetical protein